jgi:hypothetical protein
MVAESKCLTPLCLGVVISTIAQATSCIDEYWNYGQYLSSAICLACPPTSNGPAQVSSVWGAVAGPSIRPGAGNLIGLDSRRVWSTCSRASSQVEM